MSDVSGGGVVEANREQPHKREAGGEFRRDVTNVSLKKQRETFLPPFSSARPLLDAPFLWFVRGYMRPAERTGWLVVVSPFLPTFPPLFLRFTLPLRFFAVDVVSTTSQSSPTQIFLFKKSRNRISESLLIDSPVGLNFICKSLQSNRPI